MSDDKSYMWQPPVKREDQLPEKRILLSQALAVMSEAIPMLAAEHARKNMKIADTMARAVMVHNHVRRQHND